MFINQNRNLVVFHPTVWSNLDGPKSFSSPWHSKLKIAPAFGNKGLNLKFNVICRTGLDPSAKKKKKRTLVKKNGEIQIMWSLFDINVSIIIMYHSYRETWGKGL